MFRARLAIRRRSLVASFLLIAALAPASDVGASMRFAAVGDIGSTLATATDPEGPLVTAVANSIKAGNPDFIITTGDNCHDAGGAGASFLQAVSAPVTVDAAVTLGTLNLHSPGGSTLSGPAAVRLETTGGASALVSAQGGDHQVTAPVTVAADTVLEVLDNSLTLAAALDDLAAHKLTRTGNGKLVIAGSQHYGAGTVFEAADGWTVFQSDAGLDGSVLSVYVQSGATVDFAVGQSLDVLTIDAGGIVRLTGGQGQVLLLNTLDLAPGATLMYGPEPATLALVAVGLAALWRRRRHAA